MSSIPPDVVVLTGPLFLGHIFNWGLFGALSVQVYLYYISFPRDKLLPKAIVATTYVLEVLQVCMSISDGFRNFGTGWGDMTDLNTVGLLWFSVPVLGSVICFEAQLFYAWRIWILGRQPVILGAILVVAVVQLGFGIYAGAEAHIIGNFRDLQMQTFQKTAVWLGAAAFNDIVIAACMIFYLHRSNTGFRSTSTLLSKFIRLTLETGFLCAAFAILDLSFYCAFQSNNYHLAPSIPLSKLYSNSLLVVLNARIRIVGGREYVDSRADGSTISYMVADTSLSASDSTPHATSRKTRPHSSGPGVVSGISVSFAHETSGDHELHIPMNGLDRERERESQSRSETPKYDEEPLDVLPSAEDTISNKDAHLV